MSILSLPSYGKHIAFIGTTGSGKSYLASAMLDNYDSYFVVDTQDSIEVEGRIIKEPSRLGFWLPLCDKIRYIPKPEHINSADFNYTFKKLLESSTKKKKRERIIYIDEIYHVGYGQGFPAWLSKAITTARQRGLSFWIASQRPKNIPMTVLSEASKIYVFYLNKEDDIKFISTFARTGKKQLEEVLYSQQDDFSFIEIDARKGTWKRFKKIKI